MILKTIEPQHYGPFSFPTTLVVEPDVTVLTGPNDTGKSSLLRLIHRICTPDISGPEETEFNLDNINERTTGWENDPDFGAIATFQVDEASLAKYLPNPHFRGVDEITVKFGIAPSSRSRVVQRMKRSGQDTTTGVPISNLPRAILLPPSTEVRNIIEIHKPTPVEEQFLRIAFGPQFSAQKFGTWSEAVYLRELEKAKERLNQRLRRMTPPSLPLRFNLSPESSKRERLGVMLQDAHEGLTPLGLRGSGVRRVVTLLATLLETDFDKDYVYILVDEPENSLHADSQHFLRALLEELASRPKVQVIYATHSPSMINVMRPHSVRLLKRTNREGKATSVVDNRPFKENYLPIRSSLGLTPADSLLYAPVTVIVEGDTEVIGLQLVLKKLADARAPGFESIEQALSQAHLLDGMGDKFVFMCELAKSQGAKPILFLDGDKKRRLRDSRVAEQLSSIPIVCLDDGMEFEQLVPEDVYFRAIAQSLGDTPGDITPAAFHLWEQGQTLPSQMVFTKRVNRWLEDKGLRGLDKAAVMRKAIEVADVSVINTGPLLKLVEEMRRLLTPGG